MRYFSVLFVIILNISIIAQDVRGNNFDAYFRFQREIKITNDIIVGSIDGLDCFNKTKFLIFDKFGKQVLLLNNKSGVIKILNPETCHPGFHWSPLYSFFNKVGDIYVINSAPWGFRFDKNGNCIGSMDNSFLATHSFAFNSKNEIIGYYTSPKGNHLKVMDENGIEKFEFGVFPKEFTNLIYRMEAGGVITDNDDNIYQVNVNSPKIFKYNKSHKKDNKFVYYPSYFRAINEDLSNSNSNSLLRDFSNKVKGKTLSQDIFLLDDNIIAVQLYHKAKFSFGLILFDKKGTLLLDKEITYNKPIKSAKDGYIYFEYQSDADKDGNFNNPSILVYKFIQNK